MVTEFGSWQDHGPEEIEGAITPATRLISIMHTNNEVGTLQPIEQIAAIDKKIDRAASHIDALTVRAPFEGTWFSPQMEQAMGAYLDAHPDMAGSACFYSCSLGDGAGLLGSEADICD